MTTHVSSFPTRASPDMARGSIAIPCDTLTRWPA